MMPEDVGFPGLLSQWKGGKKEGLGTDITQAFLHKGTFFVLLRSWC